MSTKTGFTDSKMCSECVSIQCERPNVKIVNVVNAVDGFQVAAHLIIVDITRNALHQDVRGVAHQSNGCS